MDVYNHKKYEMLCHKLKTELYISPIMRYELILKLKDMKRVKEWRLNRG